jgi:hypothetical protein
VHTTYLVIDPGKRTGLVCASVSDDLPPNILWDLEMDFANLLDWYNYLTQWVGSSNHPVIICEDFVVRANEFVPDTASAMKKIAIVDLVCSKHDIPLFLPQAQARNAITNLTLKLSGYWSPGGKGDKREAMKHLLAYLVRSHHKPTLDALRSARPDTVVYTA